MKTYKNLYPQIFQFENLYSAYVKARRGKRDRSEVMRFECNLEGELIQLQNELIWGEYRTGDYRTFYVYEPKQRMVAALPFRDRVVQHALINIIEPLWESRFIQHSYACRPGRGMHSGANQAQQWLRDVQAAHGIAYCFKADVAKYFQNIDHQVLMELLKKKIACRKTLQLCSDIMSSWEPGLPIGNLTSQLWANIYLHELDVIMKQDFRVKKYIRYMDDFLVIHHDKSYLHKIRVETEEFLYRNLRLRLNNKTQVFPVSLRSGRALDFLGYRIWPTHRRLRKDSVKRMEKNLKAMTKQYGKGLIDLPQVKQRIASWLGHASHADSYRISKKLLWNAVFRRSL